MSNFLLLLLHQETAVEDEAEVVAAVEIAEVADDAEIEMEIEGIPWTDSLFPWLYCNRFVRVIVFFFCCVTLTYKFEHNY